MLISAALVSAACGSGGPGGASGTATSSAFSGVIAQAKSDLAKYQQRPRSIALTTPVGAPVPTGKTLDFITCGSGCSFAAPIIKLATNILGWKLNVLNNDGSPQGLQMAWQEVFRDKPDGVLYIGVARNAMAQDIAQAARQHIFVSACCTTDTVGNGIDYLIDNAQFAERYGPLYGAWAIATAAKLPADFLVVTVAGFPISQVYANSAKANITRRCPTCTVDSLQVPLSSLGTTAPNLVVSYLRAHPNVKQVLLTTDSIGIGLPAALKADGLNDVTFFGEGATPTNLEYIASGQEAGSIVFPYYEDLFGMIDALARHEAGVPVVPGYSAPLWIVTKDNVPSVTHIFPVVVNVERIFAKLWGKAAS